MFVNEVLLIIIKSDNRNCNLIFQPADSSESFIGPLNDDATGLPFQAIGPDEPLVFTSTRVPKPTVHSNPVSFLVIRMKY